MHTLEDGDKQISPQDKKELIDLIGENLEWMEENTEADKEDYDEKQAEVERIANPIMRGMYTDGEKDEADFEDEL
jgi:molecular chaperone DnaK (HSP70)